jgi:uncharacterized protein YbjQ (UPF0145 family)
LATEDCASIRAASDGGPLPREANNLYVIFSGRPSMILSTTFEVNGRTVAQHLGLVRGNVVRSRFIGRDLVAGLRMIVGGEIHEYTKLLAESREQALDRMVQHAQSLGADAVIGVRFETTDAGQGQATEVLAYGTGVKLG